WDPCASLGMPRTPVREGEQSRAQRADKGELLPQSLAVQHAAHREGAVLPAAHVTEVVLALLRAKGKRRCRDLAQSWMRAQPVVEEQQALGVEDDAVVLVGGDEVIAQ